MNEMQEKYAQDGLVIIAVNVDREVENAAAFLAEYPANFAVVYDPDAALAKEYEVQVMPSSFVIGRDGASIDRHIGFKVKKQDEYEAVIRAALELPIDDELKQ
jgi:peroxiredoxin